MQPIAFRLISKQLSILERSVRSIRAGIDKLIVEHHLDGGKDEAQFDLDNGLSKLLASSTSLRPTRVEPYQKFHSGISCGYGAKKGNFAIIETLALSTNSDEPSHNGACCLIVHPTFNQDEPADWMSLEIDFDLEQYRKLDSLKIRLLPMFQASKGLDVPNFALQIRVFYGSDAKDFAYTKFPSLSYPIELGYNIESSVIADMQLARATHVMLLFHLPIDTRADYRCIISYFSAIGTVIG